MGFIDAAEMVDVPHMGEWAARQISRADIMKIIEPRFEELFSFIKDELVQHHLLEGLAGIVLTGGSARMQGTLELAEELFQLPVRLGLPQGITALDETLKNPIYATAVGLLLQGYQAHHLRRAELISHPGFKGVLGRMKGWVQGNF